MSAAKIRLNPDQLSLEMGAMRAWLDQHRFEPSRFSCQGEDGSVLVCLEFKRSTEAAAFASRFGGESTPALDYFETGPSRSDLVG